MWWTCVTARIPLLPGVLLCNFWGVSNVTTDMSSKPVWIKNNRLGNTVPMRYSDPKTGIMRILKREGTRSYSRFVMYITWQSTVAELENTVQTTPSTLAMNLNRQQLPKIRQLYVQTQRLNHQQEETITTTATGLHPAFPKCRKNAVRSVLLLAIVWSLVALITKYPIDGNPALRVKRPSAAVSVAFPSIISLTGESSLTILVDVPRNAGNYEDRNFDLLPATALRERS